MSVMKDYIVTQVQCVLLLVCLSLPLLLMLEIRVVQVCSIITENTSDEDDRDSNEWLNNYSISVSCVTSRLPFINCHCFSFMTFV